MSLPKINVFGILLHAHLLGKSIRVRHIRNGTELPNIAFDKYYDFNFQDTRISHKELEILTVSS